MKGYIQGIYNDSCGVQIVCFTKGQAKILSQQDTFEVDVSFKRIKQRNLNEMIVGKFLRHHGKSTYSITAPVLNSLISYS